MNEDVRAYFFGNFYLSSIQQGIQAGHVISRLYVKYPPLHGDITTPASALYTWGQKHDTMILLNGGDQESLEAIFALLEPITLPLNLPYTKFHESMGALNGALTSVGVIVPMKLVDYWERDRGEHLIRDFAAIQQLVADEIAAHGIVRKGAASRALVSLLKMYKLAS